MTETETQLEPVAEPEPDEPDTPDQPEPDTDDEPRD